MTCFLLKRHSLCLTLRKVVSGPQVFCYHLIDLLWRIKVYYLKRQLSIFPYIPIIMGKIIPTKEIKNRIQTLEMKFLRKIKGCTKQNRLRNDNIREELQAFSINDKKMCIRDRSSHLQVIYQQRNMKPLSLIHI